MFNKRKSFLLSAIAMSALLAGCKKTEETNIEIVDEFLASEDEAVSTIESNADEEVLDSTEESKEANTAQQNEEKENASVGKIESNTNKENIVGETSTQNKETEVIKEDVSEEDVSEEDDIELIDNPTFTKSEITESLKARMQGKSMKKNDSISYDDLSYLTITYLDYNGKTQQGEMVVHKKLADEVLDIFREIYNAKFPIERMSLIDDYDAVDHTSMVNNNSSAFCYRTIAGTNKVSNHGMGMAIDINPFYNPHVLKKSGTVNPPEASKYADRSLNAKGMIKKNDAVYKAFTSRGWTWGGNWNNPDYQHFEKKI